MSGVAMCLPRASSYWDVKAKEKDKYTTKESITLPVTVEDSSVIIKPKYMKQGEVYPALINGELYLYRKVSEGKIEIYELAGQN